MKTLEQIEGDLIHLGLLVVGDKFNDGIVSDAIECFSEKDFATALIILNNLSTFGGKSVHIHAAKIARELKLVINGALKELT